MEPDPSQQTSDSEPTGDIEIIMISNAKKAGLSFEELNELRVRDFIKFVNIYTGEAKRKRRMATQEDIDRFFRR